MGLLPVIYLGMPIAGHRPWWQDWEGIVLKVRNRLGYGKVDSFLRRAA